MECQITEGLQCHCPKCRPYFGGVLYCIATAWCPPHRTMVLTSLVASQPFSSLVGNVDAVKVLQSIGNVKCQTLDDSLLLQKWKFSAVSNQECFEWALCTDEDTSVKTHTAYAVWTVPPTKLQETYALMDGKYSSFSPYLMYSAGNDTDSKYCTYTLCSTPDSQYYLV